MSGILEMTIYSKQLIPFEYIVKRLKARELEVDIGTMESMDNWQYKNHHIYNEAINELEIIEMISLGKIVIVNFKVEIKQCGYSAYMVDDEIFETTLWLNTVNNPELDKDVVDAGNKAFYEELIKEFDANVITVGYELIGIGVETKIEYSNDYQSIVNNSKNILKWILPNTIQLSMPKEFLAKECNGFIQYSKENNDKL